MYLKHHDLSKYWACDVEANGLTPDKIWCMCVENCATNEKRGFTSYQDIKNFVEGVISEGGYFVGHNFLRYDSFHLNRLVGTRITVGRVIDTLLLSYLYNPMLDGGHSIEAWGERLGISKKHAGIEDWSSFTPEMLERCESDASITKAAFLSLTAKMAKIGFSEKSCELEHGIWPIIERQRRNGFHFDADRATNLRSSLLSTVTDLEQQIRTLFPAELKLQRTLKYRTLKSGSPVAHYTRAVQEYPRVELRESDGEFDVYGWEEFNLASPKQRVERFLSAGWKPVEFTPPSKLHPNGQPKVDEDSILAFAESSGEPGIAALAKFLTYSGRANMIQTWLNAYNSDTGCIHGDLFLAASTRFRHSNPNTANIPGVRVEENKETKVKRILFGEEGAYTYEARDLWTTRDRSSRSLVGVDAAGIQFRMLCHAINNAELTDHTLNRDIHSFFQGIYELDSRGTAKTVTYALIFGGGDAKIGSIVGGKARDGKRIKENAFRNLPGLELAIKRAEHQQLTGRIRLCDGTMLLCAKKNAALNYELQGNEARAMRQAAIFTAREVARKGLDVLKVGDIHDEWQNDVFNKDTAEYSRIAEQSFTDAGEELRLNIRLNGNAKVGKTWAETH